MNTLNWQGNAGCFEYGKYYLGTTYQISKLVVQVAVFPMANNNRWNFSPIKSVTLDILSLKIHTDIHSPDSYQLICQHVFFQREKNGIYFMNSMITF